MPSSDPSRIPPPRRASDRAARPEPSPAPHFRAGALTVAILLAVTAGSGCFLLQQSPRERAGVEIRIENDFPSAVQISALHIGATVWREEVQQLRAATFKLEGDRLTQGVIRFLLEPRVQRGSYLLSGIVLRRGDAVRIKIEPQLDQSYAVVE